MIGSEFDFDLKKKVRWRMGVVELVVGGLYKWVVKEEVYDWGKAIPGWVVPEPFVYVVVLGCEERRLPVLNYYVKLRRWNVWCEKYGAMFWDAGSIMLYGIEGHFEEVENG